MSVTSEDYAISRADLSAIENGLSTINSNVGVVNNNITEVNSNVMLVDSEVGKLAKDFYDYVQKADRQHNLSVAETRLIKIRQEIQTKYGHYAEVRRSTTGILQADDLGIIRGETISTVTEEMMINCPNYWLAPCLVALAAWINNQPELAEKALKEGLKRNDEKTCLLFALICRRADRKPSSMKWIQRYLANQDEENLDRNCVIVIDAFASGLLGMDSEGIVIKQIQEWLDKLEEKPGFVEAQK